MDAAVRVQWIHRPKQTREPLDSLSTVDQQLVLCYRPGDKVSASRHAAMNYCTGLSNNLTHYHILRITIYTFKNLCH